MREWLTGCTLGALYILASCTLREYLSGEYLHPDSLGNDLSRVIEVEIAMHNAMALERHSNWALTSINESAYISTYPRGNFDACHCCSVSIVRFANWLRSISKDKTDLSRIKLFLKVWPSLTYRFDFFQILTSFPIWPKPYMWHCNIWTFREIWLFLFDNLLSDFDYFSRHDFLF